MLSEKRKSKKQAKEEILRKANSNKKRREHKKINQFKKALRTASSQNKGSMPSKLSKWLDEIIMTTTTTEPMAGATDDNDATASNGEEGGTHVPPTDNEANDDTPSSVGDASAGNDAPSDIGAGNNNDAPSDSGAGNGGDEDDNPNDEDDDDANDANANEASSNEADNEDETSSSCIDHLTKCLKYFSIGSLCNCCKFEDAEGMAGEDSDFGLDSDSELDDELDEHVSSLIVPNYL